ncbi:cupin domain-containing protein [Novosphingobium album (ex Liu et al. 2023)]|uniref:Cupin n=1 Tax=Novosphingobium album (ex Liu et al. 2023) TaxID=3031130 RepID=A0ABT5WNC3_9SPHN|nr:cupin [Novosphingobium album (ex Liu et al. 2023)]MDE8651534.1 cupin [Novosphingobium album (ex Liu et al. 2023)]
MAVNKVHDEFHAIDMADGWQLPEGYRPDAGVHEKVLAGSLDPAAKRGTRTRLLRFQPGAFSTRPFTHDYWEEVFLVSGDLSVGSDEQGRGGTPFTGATYAVRPPGVAHGPFRSDGGCVLLEIHYYDPV